VKIILGQPPRPGHGGSIVIGDLNEHELHQLRRGLDCLLGWEGDMRDDGIVAGDPAEIEPVRTLLQGLDLIAGSGDFRPVAPAEKGAGGQ